MTAGLLVGAVLFVVGLVATFAGRGLAGRPAGLAGMASGAAVTLVAAPPEHAVTAAVTVALTLVPLLAVAVALRRRLERRADSRDVTLDDDPR